MKKTLCVFLTFACLAVFAGAEGIAEDSRKGVEKADMSYAFGMYVASGFKDAGLEFNYGEFTKGLRAMMESSETRLSVEKAQEIIQTVFDKMDAEENAVLEQEGEKNLALGEAFLVENRTRPGVTVTPSGLQFETLLEGDGETPAAGDTVLVHYRGTTIDGEEFDSTLEDGPAEFPLNGVIPGWSEGLRMMKEGGRAMLYIPPDLAYGERGAPGAIAPNSVLVFEVELLEIVRPKE